MKVYRQWLPCKRNSIYNFMPVFMQLCIFFFDGLKMCMWFGFNPAINCCHLSTLLTLSFFAGETSTSPKFDLYFVYRFLIVHNPLFHWSHTVISVHVNSVDVTVSTKGKPVRIQLAPVLDDANNMVKAQEYVVC